MKLTAGRPQACTLGRMLLHADFGGQRVHGLRFLGAFPARRWITGGARLPGSHSEPPCEF